MRFLAETGLWLLALLIFATCEIFFDPESVVIVYWLLFFSLCFIAVFNCTNRRKTTKEE